MKQEMLAHHRKFLEVCRKSLLTLQRNKSGKIYAVSNGVKKEQKWIEATAGVRAKISFHKRSIAWLEARHE